MPAPSGAGTLLTVTCGPLLSTTRATRWRITPSCNSLVAPLLKFEKNWPVIDDDHSSRLKRFDDIRATADLKKRGEMMKELLDIAADQFECFGPCLATNLFGIQSNRLKNVPAKMPNSWSWPHPGPAMPQQFYIQS